MRIRAIAVGLIATTSLMVACGGADDDGGVASLGTGDAAASASAAPNEQDSEAALQAFSECMRDEGVEDFPDVTTNEDGGIEFGVQFGGEDQDPPSEAERRAMQDAMEACNDLLPEGTFGGGQLSPEDEAAFQDAAVEFAECMRDEGVEVPDPRAQGGGFLIGPGPDGEDGEGGIDFSDPDVQEALEKCQPIMDEVAPQGGATP